uniref:YgiW/YdeI family stress tolerance OB fold protein n=1 Tax=Thaumasiovibrio occultus TaxID=1891184 RepID=UPI00131BB96C|nr:NirD/YgiW/YdeI family stress tolerance protein [Thaumasiovibrio occultus]
MKRHTFLAAALVVCSAMAHAELLDGNVQTGVSDVQTALEATDDSYVLLEGHLVRSLGDEMYVFKDASGEMQVEIEPEVWRGLDVTTTDRVALYGEIDRDMFSTTLEVEQISKR